MKLFIILAVVTWSNAAKLDKTYLPPSNSQTSGGSGNFLQTPLAGPADYQGQNQGNGFTRNNNGFAQNGNNFAQNGNDYAQHVNEFAQNANNFAQNGNNFAQNGNDFARNGNDFARNGNGFNNFESQPERARAAFERNAAILRQDNQNDGETYSYAYETENGIYAEENGVATNGVEAQGGFSYTGDDGQVYSIRYTADQNGFVPQGEHLPTPPPIPEEILKALEQNSRDEAAGIYDDGSYNEGKYGTSEDQYGTSEDQYGTSEDQYNSNRYNGNFNNGNAFKNQNEYEGDDDSVVTNSALFRNSGTGNGAQQGNINQGTNQAYLPPNQGSLNNAPNQGGFNNRLPNQGGFNSGNQGSFNNGAQNRGFNSGSNQGSFNNGASNQGFNSGSTQDVNKAYLPPFANQRNGFGSRSRPNFSARNGYRY